MVSELTRLIETNLLLSLLVLTRLGSLLAALPAIGVGVPMRVRAMLAILLTLMIVPTVADSTGVSGPQAASLVDLTMLLARESIVGLLIGTTVQLAVTGIQAAGEIMAGTGGLQLGDALDPATNSSMPTLAQLVGLLAVATMILIGGHRLIIGSLIDSFVALPAGQVQLEVAMIDTVLAQLAGSFAAGLRVAAPVVLALLLSNLVTGLMSRTLPQLNVLAIGLSLNALALLGVSALVIGSVAYLFQQEFAAVLQRLAALWDVPRQG